MARRHQLHQLLNSLGASAVYFQPPPDVKMEYPCIVYSRDNDWTQFADDIPYSRTTRYQVTVISRDPDNTIHEALGELPMCTYSRFFTMHGLNHDIYNLYF